MTRSDAELVLAALASEAGAAGEIYDRYSDHIYSFCVSRLRNAEQAADATHDTFVKASLRLSTLREPSRLRSWLFAIARNQITDQARQRERTTSLEGAAEMVADIPDNDADLLRAESAALLWEAASSLQDRDYDLMELQLRHGLEGADLADALGVTTSHLHTLQSRMKDRLEKALGSLLIARHGREDCDELNALLADWDGKYTLAVRSKVTRHVEGCEICTQTKTGLLAPGKFFGVLPLMAAPILLRAKTAAAMEGALVASAASPQTVENWTWRSDGFPEAVGTSASKFGAMFWLTMAAIFVALGAIGGGVFFASQHDGAEVVVVAAVAPTATPIPEPTSTAVPELAPGPTAIAEPTATEQPSATAEPTATPDPTATPNPTATPVPTSTPVPTATTVPPLVKVPGRLEVRQSSLNLGLANQSTLILFNPGETAITWSGSIGLPFMTQTPDGTLGPGDEFSLVVSVNRTGLPDGVQSQPLQLTTAGAGITVNVSATVDEAPVLVGASTSPDPICPAGFIPATSVVTVNVTNRDGTEMVYVNWNPSSSSSTSTTLGRTGNVFSGTIGPFSSSGIKTLSVLITDGAGHQVTTQLTLLVSSSCIN